MADDLTDEEKQEQKFETIRWNEYRGALNIALDVDLLQRCAITSDGIALKSGGGSFSQASDTQKEAFAQTLLSLLKNCSAPVVQEFALTRIIQILSNDPSENINLLKDGSGGVDCGPMQQILKRSTNDSDDQTKLAAARALALVLSTSHNTQDVQQFLGWAVQELSAGQSSTTTAVAALTIMLRSRPARIAFAQQDGIALLVEAIEQNNGNAQLLYEACCCLWCLSYCEEALPAFLNVNAVRALVEMITAAPREKVVRVSIAALRNLIGKHDCAFNEVMIDNNILKTLATLKERKWGDEDIKDDIDTVRESLLKDFKQLSSLEKYEKELKSRQLAPGHLHSEKFWREHVMEFEKENFFLIRELVDLLRNGDVGNVAIAAADLGEFVRFYPSGKQICKNLQAKEALLPLLDHANENVQKEALLAVSKMMVDNWEHVSN
jgi:V-type H+-transporting ATPase subunit H